MGVCTPPENIIEDIGIWEEGSGSTDINSIIDSYFFHPTYLDHVETFLLKHMDKFTPEMLTDVAIMWNSIGGDPEYKLNADNHNV